VGSSAVMAGRPWPTSGSGPPRGSPRVDWRGWTARAGLRRGCAAVAGGGGRDGYCSGEGAQCRATSDGVSHYGVTTPSEIIPYYHLNHSIWSLSDNKEPSRWVLPGLHPVNHLGIQRGSNICIKLPWRRVQSALQINTNVPVGSNYYNIVFDIKVNRSEFY
jgi:hypothetical protein